MVIKELNCIFLHIPRTGGSVFSKCLKKYMKTVNINVHKERFDFGEEEFSDKFNKGEFHFYGKTNRNLNLNMMHFTIYEISKYIDIKDMYKFTFVRNPWDRLVSIYCYFPNFNKLNFNDFIHKIKVSDPLSDLILSPQYDYFKDVWMII